MYRSLVWTAWERGVDGGYVYERRLVIDGAVGYWERRRGYKWLGYGYGVIGEKKEV